MHYTDLKRLLTTLWGLPQDASARQRAVGVVGLQGIGKDACVREAWAAIGHDPRPYPVGDVVDLRPAQMEPADLLGRPVLTLQQTTGGTGEIPLTEKTDIAVIARSLGYDNPATLMSSGDWELVTSYAKPWWWPHRGSRPLLFIINEWNRAQQDTGQAFFEFIYDRKLHRHVLEEQHVICTLINPPRGNFIVQELDPAAIGRVLWVTLEPSVEDFLAYGGRNRNGSQLINQDILDFLAVHGEEALYQRLQEADYGIEPVQQPRTWEMFSQVYTALKGKLGDADTEAVILMELAHGAVGRAYAPALFNYLQTRYAKPFTAEEIMERYPSGPDAADGDAAMRAAIASSESMDVVIATVQLVVAHCSGRKAPPAGDAERRLTQFISDLPEPVMFSLCKSFMRMPHMASFIAHNPALIKVLAQMNDKAMGTSGR